MSIIQELSEQRRLARHHSNFTGYLYSVYYCHLYIFKIKFKKLKDLLRFIYVVLYSQHSLRYMFLPRPSHIFHIRKCFSKNWVACPKCWSENSHPASHISSGLSTSVQACPAYNYQHPGLFAWGLSLAAGGTNPHPMTRIAVWISQLVSLGVRVTLKHSLHWLAGLPNRIKLSPPWWFAW